jgi:3-deoxy-D-manno-octulosonate 8-phosphate phosphatase (KDO 8-P phosphatase)
MTGSNLPARLDQADPFLQDRAKNLRLLVFDFDGVFTDNMVYVSQDGQEQVRCTRADGLGLRLLEEVGVTPMILSTEKNSVVLRRAEKLKIAARNALEDKAKALQEEAASKGLALSDIWYVGNDINDLGCLQAAGLSIIVADAHKAVFPYARFITTARGGEGAVREICDLVYSLRSASRGDA